jgi:WD40 repeat protein
MWVWDVENQKAVVRASQHPDSTNEQSAFFLGVFSADSQFFSIGRADGTISVYDLASGQDTAPLSGKRLGDFLSSHPENTRMVFFSQDDPAVEIRDVGSGKTVRKLICPAGVWAFAWSFDGKRLATACKDFNIYVWDAETGQRRAVLAGHVSRIECLAFNHAGSLLASSSYDGVVRLWNPEAGRQLASYRGSGWQIQFSPDDRYLMGWNDGAHYGWLEVASSQECRELYMPRDEERAPVPAFSSDGRILATGTTSTIRVWDACSAQKIGSFPLKWVEDVIFPPDGRSLFTVDRFVGVRQRTLEQVGASAYRLGKARPFFDAPGSEQGSMSLNGRYLAVAQKTNNQSSVFDLQKPNSKVVLSGHPLNTRIALSPDGQWAATASWNNPLVKIWDARSGDLVRTITEPARAWVTFSPDGRWLATSSSEYQLWEAGTWQPKGPPQAGDGNTFTAFSGDGRMMARLDLHKIQLLDTFTEQPLATLEAPGTIMLGLCQFSPDGSQLAVVQIDQQVQLWDLRLLRQELAQMHLDWDAPPYPPVNKAIAAGPVTLEVEPDDASPAAAQAEANSTPH